MAHIFFEKLENRRNTQVLPGYSFFLASGAGSWFPWSNAEYPSAPYFDFSSGPYLPKTDPLLAWPNPFPAFLGGLGRLIRRPQPWSRSPQALTGLTLQTAITPPLTVVTPSPVVPISTATASLLFANLTLIATYYGAPLP